MDREQLVGKAMDVRVAQNGRMVLPRSVREILGMADGGTVILLIEGDEVKLTSVRQSVKHAQALYRQYATNDLSSDAFIDERRTEASRDEHG
jgi:AbrB family looped-hinge helix DNA binding protein